MIRPEYFFFFLMLEVEDGEEIIWPHKEKFRCGGDIYRIGILAEPGITH